ncbi:4-hydroxy-tetrahydrodipicolinate reductase [Ulvibacter antarcticus]|uniref:4-hydroxy-tetrahydrodipicolinate reductase n=1 Tax=Ulvibacter antarcticus TaxID=442714 RepID=A0A3L9YWX9_9FLAO|nr:4-hydroxy-tetrahydrodipicolinate reductase [Ulvibacter antarcticus]RMA64844.1 dihydrodipicolinate reductase [Ulvibacter antarcticus]
MKIALLGYGKMGKTIERLASERGHTIVYKKTSSASEGELHKADAAIDFSTPETAEKNILLGLETGIPVISGTTGWLEAFQKITKFCQDRNGSFIYASNFSVGVNLFFQLNEQLATVMNSWPEYKVSIEEIHHTQKKDAPSGTAITVAEGIIKHSEKKKWTLNEGDPDAIEIKARRIDDVKGTHSVYYTSEIDTISIKHEAHSRDGFAIGAIMAAEWILDKKGIFTMKDVLEIG